MDKPTIMDHIREEVEGAKLYMDEALRMVGTDPEAAAELFHMAKQETCHAAKLSEML